MTETLRQKPRKRGTFWENRTLRWRLFVYLVGFVSILLILLWLFQIVYLEQFYQNIKINDLIAAAQLIERNIDSDDIDPLLTRIAQSKEVCIEIYELDNDPSTGRLDAVSYGGKHYLNNCQIHYTDEQSLGRIYYQTVANGGFYTETYDRLNNFANIHFQPDLYVIIGRTLGEDKEGLGESMVQGSIFANAQGTEYFLLLNSNISPVGATADTLQRQLLWITFLMIGIALIMSFVISRRLSAPIIRINKSAKKLAHSDFSTTFDGKGYRETVELASTLNYAADELSRTGRLQQELIANISHDLRTPLTMIGGYAEAMRDLPDENNPENAQVIIDEVRRLTALVNSVLDLSKIQSGVDPLKLSIYNLTESIHNVVDNYSRLAAQEGYQILFEHGDDIWVRADESKISQVIGNFLNNALTYTGEDKQVIVRQTRKEQLVRVEVIDHGGGIPKERLPHIWERYYGSEEAHKRSSHGSGLGLSIVRGILEQHGVRFGVKSELNRGSVFWFELPEVAPEAIEIVENKKKKPKNTEE